MKLNNIFWITAGVVVIVLTVFGVRLFPGPTKAEVMNAYFKKEGFVNKKCPDNTRSDGPCLMEF